MAALARRSANKAGYLCGGHFGPALARSFGACFLGYFGFCLQFSTNVAFFEFSVFGLYFCGLSGWHRIDHVFFLSLRVCWGGLV